jgi:hypothetical protein
VRLSGAVRLKPLALVASLAVTAALVVAPVQGASADPEPRTTSSPAAARALADARALFAPAASTYARRVAAPAKDATMVLHRLSVLRDELRGDDRAAANRILARPTDGANDPDGSGYLHPEDAQRACNDLLCVHWVDQTSDKVSQKDADQNGIPDYVETVADVVTDVLDTYAAAGYRAPEPDEDLGGDARMDIYLADVGSQGYYGYCNSDQKVPRNGRHDGWAYCVLDNDYSAEEFPTNTPRANLEVTAAHELFHAVQFAYDYYEDAWFMEATATWAEDELYDDVDDNVQYLSQSPLARPATSMDRFDYRGVQQYGDWIFFRYLTEHFPDAEGGLPTIVRSMWERADSAPGGDDDYSVQAIAHELTAEGTSLRRVFADFADANRRPGLSYEEGAANPYPVASPAGRTTLSGGHRDSGVLTRKVDHLASSTFRFTRGSGLAARTVKVQVDLPPTSRGSAAIVTVHSTSGQPETTALTLSSQGDASKAFAFGSGVEYVEVTLVNASIRYRCGIAPNAGFSCDGRSKDDNLRMAVRAQAVR